MKLASLCALGLVSILAVPALAQEEGKNGGDHEAEMMKKWMEVATPGEHHKFYDYFVGSWTTECKMWMGPEPEITQGKAEYRWIFGNRYLVEDYQGVWMGQPFQGQSIGGYDNVKQMYTGFWIDSMSTSMMMMEGTLDQTGKVMSQFGTMNEWTTGEQDKTFKTVTRIVDQDSFVFEMHDLHIVPGETKVMEITYKRKK